VRSATAIATRTMNQQPDRIARLLQLSPEARIPTSWPRSTHLWADALSVAVCDRDYRCCGARVVAGQRARSGIANLKVFRIALYHDELVRNHRGLPGERSGGSRLADLFTSLH